MAGSLSTAEHLGRMRGDERLQRAAQCAECSQWDARAAAVAASAAAAASLCVACQGGPIDRPIARRNASRSSTPKRRRRVAKHALALVPIHGPAARLGGGRKRLAIHDGVGHGLRAIVGDPLLRRRRKLGAHADRDARNRHGHRCSQRLEALARTVRGGLAHALDERDGVRRAKSAAPTGCLGNDRRPTTLRGDAGVSADRWSGRCAGDRGTRRRAQP